MDEVALGQVFFEYFGFSYHSVTGMIRSIEKNPVTSLGIEPVTFRLVA
jgi:hypothetical protein